MHLIAVVMESNNNCMPYGCIYPLISFDIASLNIHFVAYSCLSCEIEISLE